MPRLEIGAVADFILLEGADWAEAISQPRAPDRFSGPDGPKRRTLPHDPDLATLASISGPLADVPCSDDPKLVEAKSKDLLLVFPILKDLLDSRIAQLW